MMQPFLIRELKISELHKSLILLYRAFNRTIPLDLESQEKLLTSLINYDIAEFLVAEEDGTIIGLGGIFFFGDTCSIGYMAVLPEVRSKGLGTSIFNRLVKIGKRKGCKTFMLYASELGAPIYQKFGFRSNYTTALYDLPSQLHETQKVNENVNVLKKLPEWAANIDRAAIGFDRREFLSIKLTHGSKLIIVEKEGYALISGLRLGPLIAKNLSVAVELIKMGILLGANNIIFPKHSKFSHRLFDLIKLTERENEVNLKMIYGKNLLQKLDYFYALGTYAKG